MQERLMNADPHVDIAAIARIGELCERLFREGTSAAHVLTALLMVATSFASLVDDADREEDPHEQDRD
jgi:hypothetical protein